MKVENMCSSNGNKVSNQFILSNVPAGLFNRDKHHIKSGRGFQSYETLIAFIDYEGKVYLDQDAWDYSVTTGKYRNQFLGETKKETQKKIDSGEYTLTDLN